MATVEEIRNKAAKKLGLFGTGQTLSDNISADIDAAYVEVFSEMECLDLVNWGGVTDDVPAQFVWSVVAWVAGVRMDEYAIPNDRFQRVAAGFAVAESRIRKIQDRPRQGTTEHENY